MLNILVATLLEGFKIELLLYISRGYREQVPYFKYLVLVSTTRLLGVLLGEGDRE